MIDSIERSSSDWQEIHCEISIYIGGNLAQDEMHPRLDAYYQDKGRGGIWELCCEMADNFYDQHRENMWEEDDFFETIDEFCDGYLDQL